VTRRRTTMERRMTTEMEMTAEVDNGDRKQVIESKSIRIAALISALPRWQYVHFLTVHPANTKRSR
jgi:hypothetical protein